MPNFRLFLGHIAQASNEADLSASGVASSSIVGAAICQTDLDSDGVASSSVVGINIFQSELDSDGVAASNILTSAINLADFSSSAQAQLSQAGAVFILSELAGAGAGASVINLSALFATLYSSSGEGASAADGEDGNTPGSIIEADFVSDGVGQLSTIGVAVFNGAGSISGQASVSASAIYTVAVNVVTAGSTILAITTSNIYITVLDEDCVSESFVLGAWIYNSLFIVSGEASVDGQMMDISLPIIVRIVYELEAEDRNLEIDETQRTHSIVQDRTLSLTL